MAIWITTVDNPFDPFTQWDRWLEYDELRGYGTCERVALLARDSNKLSEAESSRAIANAIVTLLDWFAPYEVYQLAIEGQTQKFGFS